MKLRLQKFLAACGVGSRRKSEELIKAGKIKVNGRIIREMGLQVDSEKDLVECKNEECRIENESLYFILNKPVGYVCSRSGQNNEKTVYDLLSKDLRKKVWYVGRIDKESEGLVFFTNDGELTQKMTHPKFEHEKEYEITLDQPLKNNDKKILEKGVILNGKRTTQCKIYKVKGKKLNMILKEGRSRQIRKMFGKYGYRVEKLVRVRIGKLELGKLASGKEKRATKEEML